MPVDRYGYELTTTSEAAASHWVEGSDRFLAAEGCVLDAFDRSVAADADFALGHAGRARILTVLGSTKEARAAADRAVKLGANATKRERSQIEAVAAIAYGDAAGALERIRAHVALYPRDAFALQPATNVFGLIGLSGRIDRELEAFNLLAPLAGEYGDDWWYLSTLGFWHTELGRVEQGLELNLRSIESCPRNGNAAHGLAHAWHELGEDDAGIDFLDRFLAPCPRDSTLHCHLSWHLALVSLRKGNPQRMWDVYRDAIDPRSSAQAPPMNTATDAVSLLWHAALHGQDVAAERWNRASAFVRERLPSPGSGFLEVHRALAYAMAGDPTGLESMVSAMRDADAAGKLPWGAVTPDAIQGLASFALGDDKRAIHLLAPRLDEFVRIGGSHAQRDLFKHTLIAAYLRDGRLDDARATAERTPWRSERGARVLIERARGLNSA
ncbi:MAG: tetratricopeptide repeat protein [Ramlibacter sp.]|jgi:tetratricopeptide (TPR) repeat protein|nr:tetratricopeptide repeat protein [Ramlibacter sp.]